MRPGNTQRLGLQLRRYPALMPRALRRYSALMLRYSALMRPLLIYYNSPPLCSGRPLARGLVDLSVVDLSKRGLGAVAVHSLSLLALGTLGTKWECTTRKENWVESDIFARRPSLVADARQILGNFVRRLGGFVAISSSLRA